MPQSRLSPFTVRFVGVIFATALLFAGAAARAQAPATATAAASDAFTVGPSVEGISEYTLKSNGLRVLLFPDASS
ncbi:MAG TPA: hypothetical protein PKN64_01785, partial [Casimicrobium sp.]|nr:hypothetical protein [Casimicrobium sp.]